ASSIQANVAHVSCRASAPLAKGGSASPKAMPNESPKAQDLLGHHSSLVRLAGMKAMRRRIALQSTSCEMHERRYYHFAEAFGVRTRPRVAFRTARQSVPP